MAAKLDRTPPPVCARVALLEARGARCDGAVSLLETDRRRRGLPSRPCTGCSSVLEGAGLHRRASRTAGAWPRGPGLARFAHWTRLLSEAVRAPRHAILKRLAEDVGETVNLTMLDRGEVVYLDRVETAWPLRMTLAAGVRACRCTAPPAASCCWRCCTPARRPARRSRKLAAGRASPINTIVDRRRLDTELAAIRRAGLATDNEEYLAGLVCVAVPVTAGGRVAACVAVHAPVARMPLASAMGHLPALRRAAQALGASFDT